MNPNTPADAGLQRKSSGPPKPFGTPFLPGQSGNPLGRRRGSVSLSATLKARLTKADARAIADKLIADARAGNRHAVRTILERCELPPDLFVASSAVSPTVNFIIPHNGREPYPEAEVPKLSKARLLELLTMLGESPPPAGR